MKSSLLAVLALVLGMASVAYGAVVSISDTVTDSAPNEFANHRVQFTSTTAIPASGFIVLTPAPGQFTIPVTNFDTDNVALYDDGVQRTTGVTQGAAVDGVSITTGTAGSITIQLNSTTPIATSSVIVVDIGSTTPSASVGDVGILNPAGTGSFAFLVSVGDGVSTSTANTLIAVLPNISVTATVGDPDPPVRSNGSPSGTITIASTSASTTISLLTNEVATCRFSIVASTSFAAMIDTFASTTVGVNTQHTATVAITDGATFTYYVRCVDAIGNTNADDFVITFTTAPIVADAVDGGGITSSSGRGGSSSVGGEGVPGSTVVFLVNGVIHQTVTVGSDGSYSVDVRNLPSGTYTTGLYGIDPNGVLSAVSVATMEMKRGFGVFSPAAPSLVPTISLVPLSTSPELTAMILSGYAIPNTTLEIVLMRANGTQIVIPVTTDASGRYSTTVRTSEIGPGSYTAVVRDPFSAALYPNSLSVSFTLETSGGVPDDDVNVDPDAPLDSNIDPNTDPVASPAETIFDDLDRDGRWEFNDHAIMMLWWGTDGGDSDPPADLNASGVVDMVDFSILMYRWTG